MSDCNLTLSWDLVKQLGLIEDVKEILKWDTYALNEWGAPTSITVSGGDCLLLLDRLRQRMEMLRKNGTWVDCLNFLQREKKLDHPRGVEERVDET